ncbi:MAG: 3-deoxy-manno-octulosonate cytidylyltransferase [Bacteroidia bacterium]|nr:3-deoxy-manno-octulosonate cytidylyltransferase [Bacteroidia bacterium]MCO5253552.1 3-deoxy-manno-octulosonate cytidylyltransferase [Bacteroidota bacterium]
MQKLLIVIPARYASTRFPGKPLIDIAGKTMIQRVWEQASKVRGFDLKVLVASDDNRIISAAENFGAKVITTSSAHPSGTDRCFEAAEKSGYDFDLLINIQGDEPFIQPEQIEKLALGLWKSNAEIGTLKRKIDSQEDINNPNVVKVVCDINHNALYFSRSSIPYDRDKSSKSDYFKHLGIYAFKKKIISEIKHLPTGSLEEIEKLEQLRWLQNGFKILVLETDFQSPAIDSPEDLKYVEIFLKDHPHFQ